MKGIKIKRVICIQGLEVVLKVLFSFDLPGFLYIFKIVTHTVEETGRTERSRLL